jgi:tRNA nucleotidyltransferase/poly(A) polymerase
MMQFNSRIFPEKKGVYIVGGSVRDLMLGRQPTDYDIAVLENPEKFAITLAAKTSGHRVKIGKPGQTIIRVISGKNIFDISSVHGTSIEEDLIQRDFTINAMAYDLASGNIIDCLGGFQDLCAQKVRMVSKDVFRKDPIRLIRAFRMGAHLNFEIEPQTLAVIKNDAHLIQKSAGERIREEFLHILRTSNSYASLSGMAASGLLMALFPELERLKGCFQNRYHDDDVYTHTMKAFYHLEKTLNNYQSGEPEIQDQMRQYMHKKRKSLLKCAILLHDIGKRDTHSAGNNGDVHFFGHARKSADMTKNITRRLKFSTREMGYVDFIIRRHMQPLCLFTAYQNKRLTQRGITRFFIKCGEDTPGILFHSIGDMQGKGTQWNGHLDTFMAFVKRMLHDFFLNYKPRKSKPPLITGNDLIQSFGLTPSPLFKLILDRVEEARLLNNVDSKSGALRWVRNFLKTTGII